MNAKRRVNSIARRLKLGWQWKKLRLVLGLDILVLLLCFAAFLYSTELTVTGTFSLHNSGRSFRVDSAAEGWKRVESIDYCLYWNGEENAVSLKPFVKSVGIFGGALISVECILWLLGFFGNTKETRKILQPLESIAEQAQKLTDEAIQNTPREDDRFHDLEHAIEKIDIGDKLVTGDKALEGIETAVNDMIARLQSAYRQQAQFVSDASHELRTPIAVIQGYVNMLDRWGKSDEKILEESIDAIKSETAHMKALVEQLLFLARGDSGRQQFNPEKMNLAEMMQEALDEYRMIDEKHEWVEGSMVDCEVYADLALIKQAARILADNAKRYTPEGGEIRFSCGKQEEYCFFQVQDSGIGIAKDDVPHIFDRFYRADTARARASGGTGLGLSIAKWIVERHGGWFTVTSRQDIGTRIRVCLPYAEIQNENRG